MARSFELNAERRSKRGTGAARRLFRLDKKVPAVVYGGGKESESISLVHQDIMLALENEAIYSHILTLHLSGQPEKVILKALHRHPWKPQILHVDFQRINEKEKLTIHVPLHFKGEALAPGVKAGGIVSKHMNELEVRCLPANLPESIDIDISTLELDRSIHMADITLPKGVEFAVAKLDDEHNRTIVSIHLPRAAKEEEEEVAPTAEAAAAPEAKTEGKAGEASSGKSKE